MTTWAMIAQRARGLPADKQREVLDFVEFLRSHGTPTLPRLSGVARERMALTIARGDPIVVPSICGVHGPGFRVSP